MRAFAESLWFSNSIRLELYSSVLIFHFSVSSRSIVSTSTFEASRLPSLAPSDSIVSWSVVFASTDLRSSPCMQHLVASRSTNFASRSRRTALKETISIRASSSWDWRFECKFSIVVIELSLSESILANVSFDSSNDRSNACLACTSPNFSPPRAMNLVFQFCASAFWFFSISSFVRIRVSTCCLRDMISLDFDVASSCASWISVLRSSTWRRELWWSTCNDCSFDSVSLRESRRLATSSSEFCCKASFSERSRWIFSFALTTWPFSIAFKFCRFTNWSSRLCLPFLQFSDSWNNFPWISKLVASRSLNWASKLPFAALTSSISCFFISWSSRLLARSLSSNAMSDFDASLSDWIESFSDSAASNLLRSSSAASFEFFNSASFSVCNVAISFAANSNLDSTVKQVRWSWSIFSSNTCRSVWNVDELLTKLSSISSFAFASLSMDACNATFSDCNSLWSVCAAFNSCSSDTVRSCRILFSSIVLVRFSEYWAPSVMAAISISPVSRTRQSVASLSAVTLARFSTKLQFSSATLSVSKIDSVNWASSDCILDFETANSSAIVPLSIRRSSQSSSKRET